MRNIFITLLFFCLLAFFPGCRQDRLIGEFLLTEEMKAQNPFQGGETLYFMSDSAKEFVLDGVFRRDRVYKYQPSTGSSDYYLIEVETTSVGSLLSNGIYMEMAGEINSAPKFKIQVHYKNKGGGFKFNLPLNKKTTDHIDSIRVRDKWYYDVFINEQDFYTVTRANKLYYSTRYGVIKVEWPDSTYIELEKIEWPPS